MKRFRLARGMSLGNLEAAIDGLVSSQTLSKYEHGKLQPTAATLNQIAAALGVKSAQLWGEPPCDVEWIAYRKYARLGKREQKRIQALVAEEMENRVWLQEQIQEQDIFEFPIFGATVKSLEDAEEAATALRHALNLGISPIENLIETLENHGIHIIEVDASETFDGISAVARDIDGNLLAAVSATRSGVPGDR
ncbi:MAG: helix-turn-helix transcriptional regulator, partial [Candidatus Poribacteria bacterium]|nr:helix-turn-helix transcriptional regulator [Candidatus Poribacteria bacterium]